MSKPRLRFAPSPTGYLHIGGLRTALYCYLTAKKEGGKLVLRIEDTDQERKVEGAMESLVGILEWAGIEFDEGPHKGGDYGPYIQSERLDIYKKYADKLLADCHGYKCFCTPERLEELRAKQTEEKASVTGYDGHCRNLSAEEVAAKEAAGESFVLRMKVPENKLYEIDDIVRGKVKIHSKQLDDGVIIKGDGFPTYHLASVVDDHEMKITHVVRGEEWLSSTPKHLQLYEYLGLEPPQFAHLGLLLNMDGSKLSKRQNDVAVEDYKAKDLLPEALLNFCALLGWSAGDNKEVYTMAELEEAFSLNKVKKAGSKFNLHKLEWINEQHIHNLDIERLSEFLMPHVNETEYKDEDAAKLKQIFGIVQSALHNFAEVKGRLGVFFKDDIEVTDDKMLEMLGTDDTKAVFQSFIGKLDGVDELTPDNFSGLVKEVQNETGVKGAKLFKPFRYALTLEEHGPDLPLMAGYFGKDRTKEVLSRYL